MAAAASAGADAAPPGSAHKQQAKQKDKQQAAASSKDAVTVAPELGSIGVALWWEPTRHSHGQGVVERVSFCLLPGEVKVSRAQLGAKQRKQQQQLQQAGHWTLALLGTGALGCWPAARVGLLAAQPLSGCLCNTLGSG